jgi:hypothetical protein
VINGNPGRDSSQALTFTIPYSRRSSALSTFLSPMVFTANSVDIPPTITIVCLWIRLKLVDYVINVPRCLITWQMIAQSGLFLYITQAAATIVSIRFPDWQE